MTTFVIGDVQGCIRSLHTLLAKINFKLGVDKLIFAGDLVNRGNYSLETLRFIISLGSNARTVLGNHDLYMLSCACGGRQMRAKDTFAEVFSAKDSEELLLWCAHQPLIIQDQGFTIVHAGLLPQWTIAEALILGENFSNKLKSIWQTYDLSLAKQFFIDIWDNEPSVWSDNLSEIEKYRITVNAMTRIRAVNKKGKMNFSEKGEVADLSDGYYPWFEIASRQSQKSQIVCGHWSALGLMLSGDVSHIDTGCVWGRKLTALQIPERKVYQVSFCD